MSHAINLLHTFLALINDFKYASFFPEITIGWEMTAYTTPESAGQVELCATLTGATLTTDLSPVNIRTVDGTAEAEGM